MGGTKSQAQSLNLKVRRLGMLTQKHWKKPSLLGGLYDLTLVFECVCMSI